MPSNDAGQVTVHLKDTDQYNAMVRLIDRIAELVEGAVVPGGTPFTFQFKGPSFHIGNTMEAFDKIHRLITEAKAGNWPKEEA